MPSAVEKMHQTQTNKAISRARRATGLGLPPLPPPPLLPDAPLLLPFAAPPLPLLPPAASIAVHPACSGGAPVLQAVQRATADDMMLERLERACAQLQRGERSPDLEELLSGFQLKHLAEEELQDALQGPLAVQAG